MRWLLFLFLPLLLAATSADAQDRSRATDSAELVAAKDAARVAEAKAAIAEARTQLNNEGVTNLSVILGAFGTLITVAIFGAGYFSVVSAGRAARDEIRKAKDEIDTLRAEAAAATASARAASDEAAAASIAARAASEEARRASENASAQSAQARDDAADIKANAARMRELRREVEGFAPAAPGDRKPLTAEQEAKVDKLATAVSAEPVINRTAADYRILALDAEVKKDWNALLAAARAMQGVATDAPDDMAWGAFAEAVALGKLGRPADGEAAYVSMIADFRSSEQLVVMELVAKAINNRAVVMISDGRKAEAAALLEDLDKRYSVSGEPVIAKQLALALNNKAIALADLGRDGDSLACYQSVIDRFGSATAPPVLVQVAMAMRFKGLRLSEMKLPGDALAAYDAMIVRFEGSDVAEIKSEVAIARLARGLLAVTPPADPTA